MSPRHARFMRGLALAGAFGIVAITGCGGSTPSSEQRFDASTAFRDLSEQVRLGPRPAGSHGAREEVALITRRLRDAGIREVTVQRPYRNVIATIPGSRSGVIVVGAHYDTKDIPGFVGANDGASGVAVLLELARALPSPSPGASLELVFFDAEEARGQRDFERGGARGSRQFVADARAGGKQGTPKLDRIRAMVLFDMVGDCDLRIPHEATSDPGLYRRFADAAEELTGSPAPFEGESGGVLDDHTPFLDAGIAAVDLIDFDYGPGRSPGAWWHTPADDLEHVCASSLDAVGEPAVAAVRRIAGR